MLDALQRHAFGYFLNETNPVNGLVADRTQPGAPASIALLPAVTVPAQSVAVRHVYQVVKE